MSPETADKPKRYQYKAEVRKLLDILVHSVYSSKDVFLRELISNAADALEKIRFQQLQGQTVANAEQELEIRIETQGGGGVGADDGDDGKAADAQSKSAQEPPRLIITDTGVGMTEEEARTNLGTIAHSGTGAFLERLKEAKTPGDVSFIGQFGIGFYSVFMVADKVVLTTRSADPAAEPIVWESDGQGSFSISKAPVDAPRGTRIEIHLRADERRFADPAAIESTIRNYSNFVSFPIFLNGERKNQVRAIWREPVNKVSDEEYREFFRFLTYETEAPRARLHYSADSPLQFAALLYVPHANSEAFGFGEGEVSLQLYVKRVLIDRENQNLLPRYLRFVRGVVESEDLPLSISRETLQENRIIHKIRDVLTKKLLEQLGNLARDDAEKYREFWRAFGRTLKEGYADYGNRDKLNDLLRFASSVGPTDEALVSLADYVGRMPEAQRAIYYLSGPSRDALARDPRLEILRRKGIEVLYLYEVADEIVLGGVGRYREKPLVSADQVKVADLIDVPDQARPGEQQADDRAVTETERTALAPLVARAKELLGERVLDVRLSDRLVDSPVCLVTGDGQSSHMDRLMRMMNKEGGAPKRVLELNPRHSLVQELTRLHERNAADPFVGLAIEQLFESAMLTDGYLADPHRLVARMNDILTEAAKART
ncbi:MAG: molecular chaperone HtpG [Planctomycetota bacterium]